MQRINSLRRACVAALAAAALPVWAQADAYPSKVIKLVVPYPPGGGNDVLARSVKVQWEKAWGQAVIVDNRPGANGLVATEAIAKTAGDGYTLLMGSVATHAINPALKGKQLRYNPVKDFVPIALMGSTPLVLTVPTSSKAKDLKDFIAIAKREPNTIRYASVGNGSAGHLAGALFEQIAGVDLAHIPYRGISQASTELVGGLVDAAFSNVLNVLPLIRTGKLRALGVTGSKPLEVLPGVPAIGDTLPGYSVELWWAVFGPAGTPPEVVKKLNEESNKYLATAEAKARWAADGITLTPGSPQDLATLLARDAKRWAEVVTARKIVEE